MLNVVKRVLKSMFYFVVCAGVKIFELENTLTYINKKRQKVLFHEGM